MAVPHFLPLLRSSAEALTSGMLLRPLSPTGSVRTPPLAPQPLASACLKVRAQRSSLPNPLLLLLCYLAEAKTSAGSVGLPVVGEMLRLIAAYKTEDPEPFIDERVWWHGRLFTTHVFREHTVFSADPEFNRVVLGGEGRAVECSYPSSISTLLGRHSLLLMWGALHKRMHSLTLARLASPTAIRDSPLLLHIDRLIQTTLDSWASHSRVLLLDQAKKITFELTVKQP